MAELPIFEDWYELQEEAYKECMDNLINDDAPITAFIEWLQKNYPNGVRANQKKIVSEMLKEANEIYKKGEKSANYILLSEEYIQQQADRLNVSFEEMITIIENELKF